MKILNNRFGFVLEYAEKGSLINCETKIKFERCMRAICSVMTYLHSYGIIHRDLKLGNILVDSNNDTKIADFGFSRSYDVDMTKRIGTFEFMAPEALNGIYDYRVDIYSAGIVANYLIGRENYCECESYEKKKSISQSSDTILRSMTSKKPENRPTFIEIFFLLKTKQFSLSDDQNESEINEIFNLRYEKGNDYYYYKNSKSNIDLFHCMMFHYILENDKKCSKLSHLGELLDDEFMSYIYYWIILYKHCVACDFDLLFKNELSVQYSYLNINDYRFWLMPAPISIFVPKRSLDKFEAKLSFAKSMYKIFSDLSYLHSFGLVYKYLNHKSIIVDQNGSIELSPIGINGLKYNNDIENSCFIAPEVKEGSYDYHADVYSAGVIACFLFGRENYLENIELIKKREHVTLMPYETGIILNAMLSENPYDRPALFEVYHLIQTKQLFILDDIENKEEVLETHVAFTSYKKSNQNNIDLFHHLIFQWLHKNNNKAGELSHLGKLLGDEFMSYFFDWLKSNDVCIAFDIDFLFNGDMIKRYLELDIDDYRFWLMPVPNRRRPKLKIDKNQMNHYYKGVELKNSNPNEALTYFEQACKSGNIDAKYQIGRIYSLVMDKRCFMYLNELCLNGHKKSCYYLSLYFGRSKYPNSLQMLNYFFRISSSTFAKYFLGFKVKS